VHAILGVDVGGVIIDRVNDGTDTSFFGDNFLNTTAVPEAFETLWKLTTGDSSPFSRGRTYVVSKCGRKIQVKTRRWMDHHQFFARTGIPSQNVHFCFERHQKEPICKKLNITHFVDDRPDVLSSLEGTVPHRFLFNPDAKQASSPSHGDIVVVRSWPEAFEAIQATLKG
jgi:hypothetical protein